jgi:hypothetical protein
VRTMLVIDAAPGAGEKDSSDVLMTAAPAR